MEKKVGRYRRKFDGARVVIFCEARKFVHFVEFDSPIRVRKVPLAESRYFTELDGVRLSKAARQFRNAGKVLGITHGARKFLRGL